jgi:hypothetical protein
MKSILLFSAFCISAISASAQAYDILNINNLHAGFNSAGDQLSTQPNFSNPTVTPQHDLSASIGDLWIGGYDQNGQLHVAAQTYRQNGTDFWAGAMDTITASSSSAQNTFYNKVWKINKTTIDSFRAGQCVGIPLSISSWPGNGSGGEGHILAPYVDYNGNGSYDPSGGDYPQIRGDQALFFVYNDSLAGQTHGETGGKRLGIEIHCLAYAVSCADSALVNTVFMHYEIINRSSNTYDSTVVGLWSDLDIGNYLDDGAGSDSAQNDYYYYDNYFAFGAAFLNRPMATTMSYDNNFTATGNPQHDTDYYDYMTGRWADGTHLTYGGTGYGGANSTNYCFTGNAYSGSGWTSTPNDKRIIGATGKFTFAPNQHYIIDMAYVAAYDPSMTVHNCASMVKQRMQSIKTYYNLDITPCGDNVTSISTQPIPTSNSVDVFPIPASSTITIHTSEITSQSYFIFDITGKLLQSGMTGGNETTLDIANLPEGMYFLRVGDNEKMQMRKFVVTK